MMNYFDKNKILTIVVLLLLITNIGMLAFLWIDMRHRDQQQFQKDGVPLKERMQGERPDSPGDRMPPPDKMGQHGPKEFLIHELSLNDKQVQDYEKLVDEHQSDIKTIREKMKRDRDNFWTGLSDSKVDSSNMLASQIGEDQKQMELATFRHFRKVRQLCNDEQKKKFDAVITEALKMMGQGGPPPPKEGHLKDGLPPGEHPPVEHLKDKP